MMNWISTHWAKVLDLTRGPLSRSKAWLAEAWLLGTLFKCTRENYLGALYEFTHGLVFATMPFWLGGLVLTVHAHSSDPVLRSAGDLADAFWTHTRSTFSRGELLVFAISLLSPTLWLAAHEPKRADSLPHRRPILTLAIVVILVGAAMFALTRSPQQPNAQLVVWISIALTVAAFFLRYLALVYHSYRLPDVSERDITRPTEDFMRAVEVHRRAEQ
jgi:ABC-type Fe3+ transport system permease subunit